MTQILSAKGVEFEASTHVAIIGAGACGLTAALAARDAGANVVVLEQDQHPSGSTALSSGFIPAAPTRYQRGLGIDDSAAQFAEDIRSKTKGKAIESLVDLATSFSGATIEWLADSHGFEWVVLDDFRYPGHSRHRMHTVPERTGTGLMTRLQNAVEAAGIPIITGCYVTALYADGGHVVGVCLERPDGTLETLKCKSLVLACNGFGGNEKLIAEHIPEMKDALYFGHPGNRGDAVIWGQHLGAQTKHLSGYQGHGSVAEPHGVLITWALMMEGGVQVNNNALRFSNEHAGYSEQAVYVLDQPGGVAWNIYDARLHELGLGFEDYRQAMNIGAVRQAPDIKSLAVACKLPPTALAHTLAECADLAKTSTTDGFGRHFNSEKTLQAPYYAVKVTGALFHTQGGLMIDDKTRVMGANGQPFRNLFAGGGAACGVSGPDVSGYLSGNGLLTALVFGRLAGENAAKAY